MPAALGLRKIGLCTLQLLKSVSNLQTNLGHLQNSLLAAVAAAAVAAVAVVACVAELSPSLLPLQSFSLSLFPYHAMYKLIFTKKN